MSFHFLFSLFKSLSRRNEKIISLFGRLNKREWNDQEGTLIPLVSFKISIFYSSQNWEELVGTLRAFALEWAIGRKQHKIRRRQQKLRPSASTNHWKWANDEHWLPQTREPLFINWGNKKDFFFSVIVLFCSVVFRELWKKK